MIISPETCKIAHVKIANGDPGIYQTCQIMRKLINQGKKSQNLKHIVKVITLPGMKKENISKALTYWVVCNIEFKPDDALSWTSQGLKWIDINTCPAIYDQCEPVEMLHTVDQIMLQRSGDCDDFCILLGAMHEICGIPARLVVVGVDYTQPKDFSHVYLHVDLDGKWIPIDAIRKQHNQWWGWETPTYFKKTILKGDTYVN